MFFDYDEIENKIGYKFKNRQLLFQAFVHSSYANVNEVEDNERMEFFGDAILEYAATEYLYNVYPNFDAGLMSKLRASIVSADGLRSVVEKLDVLQYLQVALGAGGIKQLSKKIEANLYEAILCAIYLDGGMEPAKRFAIDTLKDKLDSAERYLKKDYKTPLQEFCQKKKWSIEYRQLEKHGPDNMPTFVYELLIDGRRASVGEGGSIKEAEQNAAKIIVEEWRID